MEGPDRLKLVIGSVVSHSLSTTILCFIPQHTPPRHRALFAVDSSTIARFDVDIKRYSAPGLTDAFSVDASPLMPSEREIARTLGTDETRDS